MCYFFQRPFSFFTLVFSILSLSANAQKTKSYFQQQTDYTISVSLDDNTHTLTGDYKLVYTNHSSEKLRFIVMHLWANAFSGNNTAYSKQELRNGNTRFYFADTSELGSYSGLVWKINGKTVEALVDPQNPDIVQLQLAKPLDKDASVTITTPFRLRLPYAFSRIGHVGQSYFATQWYPKPAVFDIAGWHGLPYLDQGEFYSEFGKYDVTITLPDNYVVGATGTLQTASEQKFLQNVAQNTQKKDFSNVKSLSDSTPRSSEVRKTIRYTADSVHDFAFFADKRFEVVQSVAKLKSGKKIPTYGYFLPTQGKKWLKSAEYAARAVEFYSELVGEYPYAHASAVLGNGGGMEYPMITLIGDMPTDRDLDETITHEVGHNWFYGILASNERDHPWMDEGMNTYYENRYAEKYYPSTKTPKSDYTDSELFHLSLLHAHRDVAPDMNSDAMGRADQYGCAAYVKPAQAMSLLEKYLSTERFDNMMRSYFATWQFKHPQPVDAQLAFEKSTGEQLGWWFRELISSNKRVDYAITKASEEGADMILTIENKGTAIVPFQIAAIQDGKIVLQKWYNGFLGEQKITFRSSGYDQIVIDAEHLLPDVNRSNNQVRCNSTWQQFKKLHWNGLFKQLTQLHWNGLSNQLEPLRWVNPFGGKDNSRYTNINLIPLVGYNVYDKFMLGLLFKNNDLPKKDFTYDLAPMYSFDAKRLEGFGNIKYQFWLDDKIQMSIGTGFKQFGYLNSNALKQSLQYQKIDPSIKISFGSEQMQHTLQYRFIRTDQQIADFDSTGKAFLSSDVANIHELTFTGERREALGDLYFKFGLEQQSYKFLDEPQHYLKLSADVRRSWLYEAKHAVDVRFFISAFLDNTGRNRGQVLSYVTRGSIGAASLGFNDYRFDQWNLARNESDHVLAHQVNPNAEGGMKYALNGRTDIGLSNNFVVAANFKCDLPIRDRHLPVKPYVDLAYYSNTQPSYADATFTDQFLYSGGLMISVLNEAFNIYVPLFNSKNIADKLAENGGFFNNITFSVDFSRLTRR